MGQCHYCGINKGIHKIKGLRQGKCCESCRVKFEKYIKVEEEKKSETR